MHYIYTKSGAAEAMGLKQEKELNRYIEKAKKLGLNPSKVLGGIEYFDFEILKNPLAFAAKQQKREIEDLVSKQMLKHQDGERFQLTLF